MPGSDSSPRPKAIQFRVPPEFLDHLGDQIELLGRDPKEHSAVARDLIGSEIAFLGASPYTCQEAKHFALLSAEGDLVYKRRDSLWMNSDVEEIPAAFRLGQKKKKSLGHLAQSEVLEKWAINEFSLEKPLAGTEESQNERKRKDKGKKPVVLCDDTGVFEKFGILEAALPKGAEVFRESTIGFTGYSSVEQESDLFRDTIELGVEIPTREVTFTIVVDRRFYKGMVSVWGENFRPSLDFELLNGESIPLGIRTFEQLLQESHLSCYKDRFPRDDRYSEQYGKLTQHIENQIESIVDILKDRFWNRKDQRKTSSIERLHGLAPPEEYSFLHLNWKHPPVGVKISGSWPRRQK